MALITKPLLKIYLDIENQVTDYDAVLDMIIAAVGKDVVRYCNQEIEATSQIYEFSGNGSNWLIIPKFPVISITSLKYRSQPLESWGAAISSSDYAIVDNGVQPLLYYAHGFIEGNFNYKLEYISGWSEVPEDIRQVALEMAVVYFKETDVKGGMEGGRLGLATIGKNIQGIGVNTTFKDLTKEWEKRLSKYRRPTV